MCHVVTQFVMQCSCKPILLQCLKQIHIQLVFITNQELLITLGGWDYSLLSKNVLYLRSEQIAYTPECVNLLARINVFLAIFYLLLWLLKLK